MNRPELLDRGGAPPRVRVKIAKVRRVGSGGVGLLGLAWAAAIIVLLGGCASDESEGARFILDERTGRYRGLSVGASDDRLRRLFGEGEEGDPGDGPRPRGLKPGQVSRGPNSLPPYSRVRRYRDLAAILLGDKVIGFVITAEGAETRAGVGVGDSLSTAAARYRRLNCETVELGHDEPNPGYRTCSATLPTGPIVWFANDPVDSIWVLADPSIQKPPLLPPLRTS